MRPTQTLASLLLLAFASAAATADAAILASHLAVDGFASGDTVYFNPSFPTEGDGLVELGPTTFGSAARPAELHARAEAARGRLLQVRAASSAPSTIDGGGDQFASAVAGAAWRDILFVGDGVAPAQVRFNFSVSGSLTVAEVNQGPIGFPDVSRAGMLAFADDTTDLFGASLSVVSSGPPTAFAPSVKVEDLFGTPVSAQASTAWDSQSLTSADGLTYLFDGTFSLVSPLRSAASLGATQDGYLVAVGLTAGASMRGSSGESDFFGTLGLDSITLADGSPLPLGLALTFDSGIAVPEPAVGVLLAAGLVTVARRRGRSAAAAR